MLVYWRKCRWITGTQLEDLFHEAKNSNTNKHQKYVSRWGPGAFASPDSQLSLHSWPLAQAVMWETSLRTQWCSVHALGPWLSSFQTISDRWGKRQKYLHPSTATCSFCDILPPLQFLACRQQHATPKITHSNIFVHLAFPPPRKKLKWPGEKKIEDPSRMINSTTNMIKKPSLEGSIRFLQSHVQNGNCCSKLWCVTKIQVTNG